MKNVLFVASECTPFIKTGGLADVIGSLPQALRKDGQADVRVILPLYDEISEEWRKQMSYNGTFPVQLGWRHQEASLFSLEHDRISYYFIENSYYFTRKGVYGYYDDGERFIFFCKAVMEAIPHLGFVPDILHAHDWQAGVAVALAKITKPFPNLKTVFTIHNIKYQGLMPLAMFDNFLNLSREHVGGFEWNGLFNCMKGAIFHADKITTVSPSYAGEILHDYYGEGLSPVLLERKNDLTGILNGIDTNEYNPLKDKHLAVTYRDSRVKKKINKEKLQERLGLHHDGEKPLYIMITRLVEQKGLHLIECVFDDFIAKDVQFIILGTGEAEFEAFFVEKMHQYREKVKALITFDEGLARQLYASADFFLMPSKFEPCGLSQLIALQYKTVPIVRETGGLKDTVIPYNKLNGEGNGFSFTNYNAHDLLHVLFYSFEIYHNPNEWKNLIKNVNKSRYSWQDSARQYEDLYDTLKMG
ncbi:glycogen synthase [Bacillaceae bacterium Marseille-Q3522]|nr:glycogen synthase [Bacillaceae bacterium Marseille-Q3522]